MGHANKKMFESCLFETRRTVPALSEFSFRHGERRRASPFSRFQPIAGRLRNRDTGSRGGGGEIMTNAIQSSPREYPGPGQSVRTPRSPIPPTPSPRACLWASSSPEWRQQRNAQRSRSSREGAALRWRGGRGWMGRGGEAQI